MILKAAGAISSHRGGCPVENSGNQWGPITVSGGEIGTAATAHAYLPLGKLGHLGLPGVPISTVSLLLSMLHLFGLYSSVFNLSGDFDF